MLMMQIICFNLMEMRELFLEETKGMNDIRVNFDAARIRKGFPILVQQENGKQKFLV